jgi:tRNA(Ile)-lysidine synthase
MPRGFSAMTSAFAREDPVIRAVRAMLASLGAAGAPAPTRIAVALSGGRDSMVLLDALAALAAGFRVTLSAIHVHHGLSPNADAWAAFCERECARRGVALTTRRVAVRRVAGESLEAAAREARYAALACAGVDCVALAHHADDQAETVLLQLLRGAGPGGLAAMSPLRVAAAPAFVRPLLAVARAAIDARARECGIAWIDDESNDDPRHRRNYLRREIAPRLAQAFPGYPGTLVRAAGHAAEAAALLDALAAIDAGAGGVATGDPAPTLERRALVGLAASDAGRARNLLRWFLRRHGLPPPSTARLGAMLDQLLRAAPDARLRLAHAGAEIGVHRGRIVVHRPAAGAYEIRWRGEPALALPHGTLAFVPGNGGLACDPATQPLVVRPPRGGETLRLGPDRPRRAVRRLFQEAGIPAWERRDWPLVWCGEALAAVPGIGVAAEFLAAPASGYALQWQPGR